ncbi:hypothetical protein C2E20_7436 [Micractinium conductrix]|uniref:SAM domain-containing protein n=1 Tax=Micractinium conductrix TaxID=554055 RepID=A0A2P6V4P1_9CHLO|nr:hypothetical protein C2E20_7436 [Micractinium conductrix]|eukprot:PSC69055.1 hypothetical protein C2E20_7436 [Micractinium conductrix]
MPAAGPSSWTVADVAEWLEKDLELPAGVVAAFKDNAIAGPDLLTLTDEDLTGELGCKPLQARKIRNALVKMGFTAPGGAPAAAPAPAAPAPVAPEPTAPEPAPVAAVPAPAGGAPAGYPPPGYGAPPPAAYAPPPQEPEKQGRHGPSPAAAAVLLTRGRRMQRRGFMAGAASN